eukprot:2679466-Rhodomonas_salina.2
MPCLTWDTTMPLATGRGQAEHGTHENTPEKETEKKKVEQPVGLETSGNQRLRPRVTQRPLPGPDMKTRSAAPPDLSQIPHHRNRDVRSAHSIGTGITVRSVHHDSHRHRDQGVQRQRD